MVFASEEGFVKIRLASDCLSVIQRIRSTTMDRSFLGVVIQDIKKMASLFSSCSFLHVPRLLNESAHVLARCSEQFGFASFRLEAPVCIHEILCNDYD
jgi:hypothetical protein